MANTELKIRYICVICGEKKVTIPHLTFLKILAASPIDCVMPLKFYIDKSVQPLLIFSATLYGSSSLYSSSVMLPCSLGSMYSK